jgi:hypothetical protein
MPVRSSPLQVASSRATASMHFKSARPPPGTMPSATGLCRADGLVERFLLRLHLGFGWGADANAA